MTKTRLVLLLSLATVFVNCTSSTEEETATSSEDELRRPNGSNESNRSNGSKGAQPTPASFFAGHYSYRAGSTVTVTCPGAPALVTDLTRVPPQNVVATFDNVATSPIAIHHTDALGCAFDFIVQGRFARASGGTCNTYPDGRGGITTLALRSASFELLGPTTVAVAGEGIVGGACTLVIAGTASRAK